MEVKNPETSVKAVGAKAPTAFLFAICSNKDNDILEAKRRLGMQYLNKWYLKRKTVRLMKRAGTDPAFIYAFKKTERLVTEENKQFLTEAELKEWDEAIKEYYSKKGKKG